MAWTDLKARTTPEQLAAAYQEMNIRDDGSTGSFSPSGQRQAPASAPPTHVT